jgi:hypothetical protein
VPLCKTRGAIGVFHNFPANLHLRAKWQNICELSKVRSNDRVCQLHFDNSDYYIAPGTFNDLNEERRPILNSEACPSFHVPRNESTNDLSDSNSSTDQQTLAKRVEENAIAPDIINAFNEENIKSRPSEKSNLATKRGTRYTIHCSMPLCKTKGAGAGFHSFPTNPDLRSKWLNICQLSTAKTNKRVCQLHFEKSDYFIAPGTVNALNKEMIPRLKPGACPVRYAPKNETENELSDADSTMNCLTIAVKAEEIVITPDTIDDFNEEEITSTLKRPSEKSNHAVLMTNLKERIFTCSVPLCGTHGSRSEFHTFPTNPDRRTKWQNICQLSKVKSNDRVCQLHFNKSDYFHAPGTFNGLNEERRARLHIGACPVLHVPQSVSTNDLSDSDSSMDPLTCVVKVEENVIAPDSINDFIEEKIEPKLLSSLFYCSVPLCQTKGAKGEFHHFPTNPDRRAKWQNICQLSTVKSDNRVCQLHFNKSDYVIAPDTYDLKSGLIPRLLKKGACPILHVPKNELTQNLTDSISSTDPLTCVLMVEESDLNEEKITTTVKSYPRTYYCYCSVPLCKTKGPISGFHSFPTNPDLRAKWLNICQLSTATSNNRVCQLHFGPNDYFMATGNDLNPSSRLKKGACPILNIPKNESTNDLSDFDSNMEPQTFELNGDDIKPWLLMSTSLRSSEKSNQSTLMANRPRFYCSVPQCKTKGTGGGFHSFPTNPDLRARWLNICQLLTVKSHNRVCQLHFEKSDYVIAPGTVNALKKEMIPRLKTGACPVVNFKRYCSVPQCKTKTSGAGFHSFPTNPNLRAKWLNICQLSTAKAHAVCQLHFNKSDYMIAPGTLNALNEELRPRLERGACPNLLVPKNDSTNSESVSSTDPLTFVMKVEENVINPDTINDFYEEKIKPRLLSSTLKRSSEKSNHAVLKANLKDRIFKCSVPLCKTKGPRDGFHAFPSTSDRRAKWQNICQLSKVKSNDRVCQLHFDKSDYLNAFNFNVLNEEKRAKLNIEACPSLHVPENETTNALSYADSRMDQQTFVVREVEENVLNEDIKPSLEIGAFPVVLPGPNESINDLPDDFDSSTDPLAVTVKMEH